MKPEIIKEQYEVNSQLNTLYDILDALYSKYKDKYPDDIKSQINGILSTIDKYTYPKHNGYDLINEKWYSEFTFKKSK